MRLNQKREKADVILVLWTSDTSFLSHAADLYKKELAPKIICTGKWSPYMSKSYSESEAEHFRDILVGFGVSSWDILLEPNATNTWENMRLSYKICKENWFNHVLIVQKPFYERRAYATAMFESFDWWRPSKIIVHCPKITPQEYDKIHTYASSWIDIVVWDVHRIIVCNKQWRIIPQEIPQTVLDSFHTLLKIWHDTVLMKWYDISWEKIDMKEMIN